MNTSDRLEATDIDRHWDAYALEEPPAERSSLDPETAALLARMWEWSAPPHSAATRERVWQRLQKGRSEEDVMITPALPLMPSLIPEAMRAPHARIPAATATNDRQVRRQGGLTSLATAALLVLALLGGLVASGALPRPWQPVEPPSLPAVLQAPATPASSATRAATLLDVTIPLEQLPQGDRISSIFEYATSPAESTGRWLPANSYGQPGLRVQHLLDGDLTVRADAASQLVRAGSTTLENVAARAEITLAPGDTWIVRNETVFEATNPNDAPASVLVWVLANVEDPGAVLNYPVPSTWIEENYVLDQPAPGTPGIELPTGSARLRIQQLELEPKASYPAPEQGLQYGIASPFTANGSPVVGPSVTAQPNGKVVNIGRKAATAYVLNLTASAEATGTP